MTATPPARRLDAVARRQHGLFTAAQVASVGFTNGTAARRLAAGTWHEVEAGVYRASPSARLTWSQSVFARVLATRGVASHSTAAALLSLVPETMPIEVTVRRTSRTATHASVHSTNDLSDSDVATVAGIPSTSPVRTLIDLGGQLDADRFEDVLDLALTRGLVLPAKLAARAAELRAPRRAGCAAVLRLLEHRSPQAANVRNQWEARLLRAMARAGLPQPECNFWITVGGRRRCLDFAWPEHRVVVEFDGFEPHSPRRVFDDDRVRQNALVDAGWRMYRLTATSLRRGASEALAPVARALLAQ